VRVLAAMDCFGGTLSAAEAAAAVATGWRRAAPRDEVVALPLSDGGPGLHDVLAAALPAARSLQVATVDPLGRPVTAAVLVDPAGTGTAYVESAQACGLHLLAPDERDPERACSTGLARLLAAAAGSGVGRVVVGVGGSASTDGGAGMVAALSPAERDALGRLDLVLAADVDAPLTGPRGAARVFAAQKGAGADAVARLEARLEALAARSRRDGRLAEVAGAGAGGGIGFALLGLGARAVSGFELVAGLLDVAGAVGAADLVVTGEGRVDATSLHGKVVAGVAGLAAGQARTCVLIAGEVALARRRLTARGISAAYDLVEQAGSRSAARGHAARHLVGAAYRAAGCWSGPR
jgi:glycerate kinase